MLKIKDNVDLKELEKFGFKKIDNKYFYFMEYDNIGKAVLGFLEVDGRELNIGYTRTWEDYEPEYIAYDVQEKLFDLTQAGLVEKVVE